jgi:SAM-dependent methyltransferase
MRRYVPKTVKLGYHALARALGGAVIDRIANVETADKVDLEDFGLAQPNRVGYEAGSWLDLPRILRRDEIGPDDVFLDLGSGKGRMVLVAARYPFKRVIGVELSDSLTAIARSNVTSCRFRPRCHDIELVTADVLDYRVPDDVSVVYLFNPFRGPIFDKAMARLIASVDRHPRVVRVIYRNALYHDRLMQTGRFRPLRAALGWRPGREWREATAVRLYALEPARCS